MKTLLAALAAALVVAPSALGGGWATVQLSSTPAGTPAGGTWSPTLTVLQHGRTPLEGVTPVVRVTDGHGATLAYEARPTDEPGRYRVDVAFPRAGTWRWEIWDGFSRTHGYRPVRIGPEATTTRPGRALPAAPAALVGTALALLAAGGVAWRLGRARRVHAAR